MVYNCSRCSRHFNSKEALSSHETGFHKVTLFDSDEGETNKDSTNESNESCSEDEPTPKRERRTRAKSKSRRSYCNRKGVSRDSSSGASSDEEETDSDTESRASATSHDSGECCEVCRTLHKPDRVDFWCEPLAEYHILGIELMLRNEDSTDMLTKLMQFLELPQTEEEKMLTTGEHLKGVIASIMQAASNGEMVVTRKILRDIVRLSSSGLSRVE
ncbi:hypothetical protein Fcan01_27895 [Folsomia candida]|uniref:C2H2-type domain-containing protein n=1 Tax=Folsomia candida TaxID=158441 RepID=A0A226CXI9_FOLCA|nr:hypothetical protein Fcan01_27895 [Folsomia candida]